MNDDKHVDFAALKYYDERNKQYIDTKVNTVSSDLKDVERRVDTLEATSSGHTEQLISHREELDDLESRVITLERDDVSIRKDIADIRVALENASGGNSNGVSKDYVDNKIEEAIKSLDIPDTSTFVTEDEFATVQEQIENIQTTYVTTDHLETHYVTNDALEQKNYVTEQFVTNNYVTNETIQKNYSTTEEIAQTYVTSNEVSEQIETTVTQVIQEKVDSGEITVKSDSISYDTW